MSNFHLKFKIQWLSLTAAFNWRERCGWGWRQTAAMEIKQVCRVCGQFCRRTYWPTQVAAQRAASLPLRGWAALWNLKWKNVMSALAGQQLKELPLNGGTFFQKMKKNLFRGRHSHGRGTRFASLKSSVIGNQLKESPLKVTMIVWIDPVNDLLIYSKNRSEATVIETFFLKIHVLKITAKSTWLADLKKKK